MMPWATKGNPYWKGKGAVGKGYKGDGWGSSPYKPKPINCDLLLWYLCPNCFQGKWCVGNNPPTHCKVCQVPCQYSHPILDKGKGKGKQDKDKDVKGKGKDNDAKGKGKYGKDDVTATTDKGSKGKGKDGALQTNTKVNKRSGKGWNVDEAAEGTYDKDTTIYLINQLLANGNADLAGELSTRSGLAIPSQDEVVDEVDVYKMLQSAEAQKKQMKKEKGEQLNKLVKITKEIEECEEKISDYDNKLAEVETIIIELKENIFLMLLERMGVKLLNRSCKYWNKI